MRRVLAGARTRLLRIVAVSLPVTVAVGLLAQGQGFPVPSHPMDSGGAWVASLPAGKLTLIDGPSKQLVTDVDVAQPGEVITAVQAGTGAYVANQTAGTVTRVDGATYSSSEGIALISGAGPGLQVFAGDRLVYVLDRERGAVVAADKTLRRSQPPASLAASVADGAVDTDGRLWILDGASGDLIRLDDTGRDVTSGLVDPGRADVELAGDRLAVIDQTTRTIHVVEPRGPEIVDEVCIDVAADDQSLRVSGSPDARRINVVSGQRGVLLTSDLDSGECSSFVQVAEPGSALGVPQEAGGRVFVPNYSTGQVHIVDISEGQLTADADVFDNPKEFELLARNGIVFYNDPHGRRAGVIDLDGTVHPINKYDADNRGNRPEDTPGRGRKGDGRDGEDKRDDSQDRRDQDTNGNRNDPADGDPPDSDQPGGRQPLQPLDLQPDADTSEPLPDLGLPPAPTGDDPPQTDPGGINPPVVEKPSDPGGPAEPPDDGDPTVEPPVALKSCNSFTLTAGDELQCTWANSRAGDPPGTSLGGQPETWEWRLTGPEGPATATGPTFNRTLDTPGTYELTLTVANAGGSDFGTTEITVTGTAEAPNATFTCNSTSLTAGDRLQCDWSGAGATPDTWEWQLTGPGVGTFPGASLPSFTRTMNQAGTFQLTLTVANSAGDHRHTETITVAATSDPPQITRLTCQTNRTPAQVGDRVTCTATTSGTVDRLLWTWTRPDGGGYTRQEQQSLGETLTQAGVYSVTVVAQSAGQETSRNTTVAAQASPEPPQITSWRCSSPGGLGNEDPPQWFGGQALTCNVTATGDVDSYEWTFTPGGIQRTGDRVQFGLPAQPPGDRTPGRVDLTVSGAGGSVGRSLDFIIRACDNHPDPPCRRM